MSVEDVSALIEADLREVPYNNFGKIRLASGLEMPEELGGNCVEKVRRLTNKLADIEGETANLLAYALVAEGDEEEGEYYETYHHAIAKQIDGEWYFIDPTILLSTPIPIERILASPQEYGESGYVFDAAPVVNGQPTHVIVKPTGERSFSIRLEVPKKEGYKVIHEYHYFLDENEELPASDDFEIATIPEDFFLIRFSVNATDRVTLAFDAEECETIVSCAGQANEWQRWVYEEDEEGFAEAVRKYVPESAGDPVDLIHMLWNAPGLLEELQKSAES